MSTTLLGGLARLGFDTRLVFHSTLWIAAAFALAVSDQATARTWYILPDGNGDAPTIQAGIDAATEGDVILVAAGTYATTTSVVIGGVPTTVCAAITKNIVLTSESGPGSTTIGNPSADIVVYLEGVGSTAGVIGFRIQTTFVPFGCVTSTDAAAPAGPAPPGTPIGIKCVNSPAHISGNHIIENGTAIRLDASPALVAGNTIELAYFGVFCNAGSDADVTDNVIHDCAELVRCEGSDAQVFGNELYVGCTAVYCLGGSDPIVSNNRIHDISPIAIAAGAGGITVEDNRFWNTNLAIQLNSTIGTTVVRRNVFYNQVSGAVSLSDNLNGSITIEENTIDKTTSYPAIFCQRSSSPLIRRNVIVRSAGGVLCELSSFPVIECNNIFGGGYRYGGDCTDQTGVNGNISVDPQFCGVDDSGNYYLQGDSPCAPGGHPDGEVECGQIGAFGVGCGTVSTKKTTWGGVKSIYRGDKK